MKMEDRTMNHSDMMEHKAMKHAVNLRASYLDDGWKYECKHIDKTHVRMFFHRMMQKDNRWRVKHLSVAVNLTSLKTSTCSWFNG